MIKKEVCAWINWGRQKQAVLRVLNGPITPSEILRKARIINPRLSFGDVSALLREFEKRGIIKCLTPTQLTGKIYCPTSLGRELLQKSFAIKAKRLRHDIDWNKYARVLAGKTRRRLLTEMYNCRSVYAPGATLSVLRRRVNRAYPLTLNQTFCAMRALLNDNIAEIAGYARKRNSKLYRLTPEGIALGEMLVRNSQQVQENLF